MTHPSLLARSLVFVLGVVVLSSCATFRPKRDVEPNTLGVALPLTGKYALVGDALLSGVKLGLKNTNVKLVVRDTQGEPDIAERMIEELAQTERVVAILGGVAKEEAEAMARKADKLGAPLISFSRSKEVTSAGSFVFRNMLTLEETGEAVGRYASCQMGLRSFAVLAPDTDYGKSLTEAFTRGVEEHGGKVTMTQTYQPDQTTFTPEAQKLTGHDQLEKRADYVEAAREIAKKEADPFRRRKALEKLRRSLPPVLAYEALFLPDGWETVSLIAPALAVEDVITNSCNAQDLEKIRKTLGREKLDTVTLLGWSGWASPANPDGVPKLLERGGKFLECSVYADAFFPGASRSETRRFVESFKAANKGIAPNLLNAVAYDSTRLFVSITGSGSGDAALFRERLAKVEKFEGAMGVTSISAQREFVRPLHFLEAHGNELRSLPGDAPCKTPAKAKTMSRSRPGARKTVAAAQGRF